MAIFLPRIIQAKIVLKRSFSNGSNTSTSMDTPKGYFAVYVGEEEKKRFVVSISLLSQPAFQELLHMAEEQFGYDHPMGGLTIPCSEDIFFDLASRFGTGDPVADVEGVATRGGHTIKRGRHTVTRGGHISTSSHPGTSDNIAVTERAFCQEMVHQLLYDDEDSDHEHDDGDNDDEDNDNDTHLD
ncbi:hypothetical protein R6Q57_006582 [Mikania cordata]